MKEALVCLLLLSLVSGEILQLPLISHEEMLRRRRRVSGPNSDTLGSRKNPSSSRNPRHHLRRRLQATGYLQNGPLYEGYGTHYVDIWVGTPPQRQTLIVDTGSSQTAFPCSTCRDCGTDHINPFFQEKKSTTFRKLICGQCRHGRCGNSTKSPAASADECAVFEAYAEGSTWGGFEGIDKVSMGRLANTTPHKHSVAAFDLTFGCQTRLSGPFRTQLADGIAGMNGSPTSLWRQMFALRDVQYHSFSICYAGERNGEGTQAGVITMGGLDRSLHKSPLVYSSTRDSPSPAESIYFVKIRRFYLRHWEGGELAKSAKPAAKVVHLNLSVDKLNEGGIVIDSGSTDTYYLKTVRTEFRRVFKLLSDTDFPTEPFKSTPEEIMKLPTILLQLMGSKDANEKIKAKSKSVRGLAGDLDPKNPYDVILAFPPSHYMRLNDQGLYEPRFYPYEDPSSGSVLGANILMGHDVVFDVNNNRIGWAQSDCKFSASSEPDGTGGVNVVETKRVGANDAVETGKGDADNNEETEKEKAENKSSVEKKQIDAANALQAKQIEAFNSLQAKHRVGKNTIKQRQSIVDELLARTQNDRKAPPTSNSEPVFDMLSNYALVSGDGLFRFETYITVGSLVLMFLLYTAVNRHMKAKAKEREEERRKMEPNRRTGRFL